MLTVTPPGSSGVYGFWVCFGGFGATNSKSACWLPRYKSLSPADKIALSVSRLVLSNSQARLVFVGYILFIHGLVFMVLMRYSHHEATRVPLSEQCMHRFAEHMSHIHHGEDIFANGGTKDADHAPHD